MENDKTERNKTVGQIASDLATGILDEPEHTVSERIDLSKNDYWNTLVQKCEEGKKTYDKDFFIELCVKREKLMWNIQPRWLGRPRQTCPTPMFDQSVFRYIKKDDILEYLWTVPDMHSCSWLIVNALNVPEEQKELLKFAFDFKDGTLYKMMKKLNKEE